jgi:hypothetical protein
MTAIQQVYQNYQSQGLVALAINASYQGLSLKMQTFVGSFTHFYLILRDENGEKNRLYAISSLPATLRCNSGSITFFKAFIIFN